MTEYEIWSSLFALCVNQLRKYKNEVDDNELIESKTLRLLSLLSDLITETNINGIEDSRFVYARDKEDETTALNEYDSVLFSDLLALGFPNINEKNLNELKQKIPMQPIIEQSRYANYARVLQEMGR